MDGINSTNAIGVLEVWADLELTAARREALAGLLAARIRAANELSRFMAQPRHRALTPAVHPLQPKSQEQRM